MAWNRACSARRCCGPTCQESVALLHDAPSELIILRFSWGFESFDVQVCQDRKNLIRACSSGVYYIYVYIYIYIHICVYIYIYRER